MEPEQRFMLEITYESPDNGKDFLLVACHPVDICASRGTSTFNSWHTSGSFCVSVIFGIERNSVEAWSRRDCTQ